MSKFSNGKEEIDGKEFNIIRKAGYKLKTMTEEDIGKTYRIDNTKELWYSDDEKQELIDLLSG